MIDLHEKHRRINYKLFGPKDRSLDKITQETRSWNEVAHYTVFGNNYLYIYRFYRDYFGWNNTRATLELSKLSNDLGGLELTNRNSIADTLETLFTDLVLHKRRVLYHPLRMVEAARKAALKDGFANHYSTLSLLNVYSFV